MPRFLPDLPVLARTSARHLRAQGARAAQWWQAHRPVGRREAQGLWAGCTTSAMVEQTLARVWPWDCREALREMPTRLPALSEEIVRRAGRWGPGVVQAFLQHPDLTPALVAPLLDGVDAAYFAPPIAWTTTAGVHGAPLWSHHTLHACWEAVGHRGWSLAEIAPNQWRQLQQTLWHAAPVEDAWAALCAMPSVPPKTWSVLLRRSLRVPGDDGPALARLLARSDLRATQRAYIVTRALEQRDFTSAVHRGRAEQDHDDDGTPMTGIAWDATVVALPGVLRGLRRVLNRNDLADLYMRRSAYLRHLARACLDALGTAAPDGRAMLWDELAAWAPADRTVVLQTMVEAGTPAVLGTTEALSVLLLHAPDACRVTVLQAIGQTAPVATPEPPVVATSPTAPIPSAAIRPASAGMPALSHRGASRGPRRG